MPSENQLTRNYIWNGSPDMLENIEELSGDFFRRFREEHQRILIRANRLNISSSSRISSKELRSYWAKTKVWLEDITEEDISTIIYFVASLLAWIVEENDITKSAKKITIKQQAQFFSYRINILKLIRRDKNLIESLDINFDKINELLKKYQNRKKLNEMTKNVNVLYTLNPYYYQLCNIFTYLGREKKIEKIYHLHDEVLNSWSFFGFGETKPEATLRKRIGNHVDEAMKYSKDMTLLKINPYPFVR